MMSTARKIIPVMEFEVTFQIQMQVSAETCFTFNAPPSCIILNMSHPRND
jgi:hypothetical protein